MLDCSEKKKGQTKEIRSRVYSAMRAWKGQEQFGNQNRQKSPDGYNTAGKSPKKQAGLKAG